MLLINEKTNEMKIISSMLTKIKGWLSKVVTSIASSCFTVQIIKSVLVNNVDSTSPWKRTFRFQVLEIDFAPKKDKKVERSQNQKCYCVADITIKETSNGRAEDQTKTKCNFEIGLSHENKIELKTNPPINPLTINLYHC